MKAKCLSPGIPGQPVPYLAGLGEAVYLPNFQMYGKEYFYCSKIGFC